MGFELGKDPATGLEVRIGADGKSYYVLKGDAAPGKQDRYKPPADVTGEGLNIRHVNTVPINPFTGSPVGVSEALRGPTQQQIQAIRAVEPRLNSPGGIDLAAAYGEPVMIPSSSALNAIEANAAPPPVADPDSGGGFDFFKTVGDVANTATGYVTGGVNAAADMGKQALDAAGNAGVQAAHTVKQAAPLVQLMRMFGPYNPQTSPYVLTPEGARPRLPPSVPANPGTRYGATPEARIAAEQRRQAIMIPGSNAISTSGYTGQGATAGTDWGYDVNYYDPNNPTARQRFG